MKTILNGRTYVLDDYLLVSPNIVEHLDNKVINSNGCGTNWFNKIPINMLQAWAHVELIKCCIVHDLEYEYADGSHGTKIRIDAQFHANIYNTCLYHGVTEGKSKTIARFFHMAVIYGGGKSYNA